MIWSTIAFTVVASNLATSPDYFSDNAFDPRGYLEYTPLKTYDHSHLNEQLIIKYTKQSEQIKSLTDRLVYMCNLSR